MPRGRALKRATARNELEDPAGDPLSWISQVTGVSHDDLDQVRLLRIHLASNRPVNEPTLMHALNILERAHAPLSG